MSRVARRYAGPTVLVAGILLVAFTATDAGAQSEDCPRFTAPSIASEEFVAFGTTFEPITMDFGTSRVEDASETILTAQPPQGQQLPRGPVEVEVNTLRRSTHGSLTDVNAAAATQGRNRVRVRLCVDPTTANVGTYTGFVVVTDPRFDTTSVPVTIRLQSTNASVTWFVPFLLALSAVALAAASIEARGPADDFFKRFKARLFGGIQSLLVLLPTLGVAYAAWAAEVANNPTWGEQGLLSLGSFWLIGASAVTTATAVFTTSAAAAT